MAAEEQLNLNAMNDLLNVAGSLPQLHDAEADCNALKKARETMRDSLAEWRAKQSERNARISELQKRIADFERQRISLEMEWSTLEDVQQLKEEVCRLQEREMQMRNDSKDLEDCVEGIEDQLVSIQIQKETLEKPDPDVTFLKNELSLLLNVSSILPDLGDPKFAGTYVDKQKGVKTFKFPAENMTPFEISQAAWELMR